MATKKTKRNIQALTQVTALPAGDTGGATVQGAEMDLSGGGMFPENIEMDVSIPAIPVANLPADKTLTVSIQDSDTEAFTASHTMITSVMTVVGVATTGSVAQVSNRFKLPSTTKQFIRVVIHTDAETLDPSGIDATFKAYN